MTSELAQCLEMEEAGQLTHLHLDYDAVCELIHGIDFEAIKSRTLGQSVAAVKINEKRYWRRYEIEAWITKITHP